MCTELWNNNNEMEYPKDGNVEEDKSYVILKKKKHMTHQLKLKK